MSGCSRLSGSFQPGGARIRAKGIRVESLAKVKSMSEETGVEFED